MPDIEPTFEAGGEAFEREYRALHAASLMALFCVGAYAAAFGPVLPFLAADVGISLDTAGLLLTALFAGSISASALIAVVLHARDMRALAIAGVVAAIGGTLLIGIAPTWPLALVGGVVLGVGDGLMIAALHVLIGLTSRDVTAAMNRLNLYFAFGAVTGAVWSGAVLATSGDRAIVYAGIAAIEAITLAMFIRSHGPGAAKQGHAEEFHLPVSAAAWTMGAVLFLYVGAEFGLGAWVSSYTRETADAGVFAAALLAAAYWAALALGRVFSTWYFGQGRDAVKLLTASIAGAGVASLVLVLAGGNIWLAALAAFGAGMCLGPIWPTTIAVGSRGAAATATVTAAIVTIGNAGGLAIPWLQGRILVGAGATAGVAVTVGLCMAMLALVIAFQLREGEPLAESVEAAARRGEG